MKSFFEAERQCRSCFDMCGEAYHAFTSGKEMPIIFTCKEELIFAMNVIALAAFTFKELLRILTFEIMDNHFHFVICGTRQDIEKFFLRIIKKLKRTIPMAGRMRLSLKPIQDLSSMRNNIIYTNRNGYVANPDSTPFSYPWGAGRYYFNDIPAVSTFKDIGYAQNRAMFRGDNVTLPSDWKVEEACSMNDDRKRTSSSISPEETPGSTRYISPPSFCDISLGMAMFRDAHQYFSMVSKNVEAYGEVAVDIDDGEFLTDQELFSQLLKVVREKYRLGSLRDLSNAQKLDLARTLHYDYRSSNGQIRRVLGMSQYDIDQLFKTH